MLQRWESVSFVHWSYEPAGVGTLLPPGLVVDTFDDRAWVSMVAFFVKARLPFLPAFPPLTYFAQVNVRTYVIGPQRLRGLWFLSLDADSLGAALAGRLIYDVPFHWSRTSVSRSTDTIDYSSQRRANPSAGTKATVETLEPFRTGDLDALSTFLTDRYLMFAGSSDRLMTASVTHRPWPLHRARLRSIDDRLLSSAGLETPGTPQLAHWSPGVLARINLPRTLPRPPA
ncbi:MAG TPA: DUF2071 domain-containing protein [Acidimicrobiia bacterium]|nr:DUF2071 domain-containing protein [Acidimicrobiia bacterium]